MTFRSTFLLARFLLAGLFLVGPTSQSNSQQPTLTQRIDGLRMTSGHFPDAFLENKGAAGFRWYFSTIGVQSIATDLKHDEIVRAYLNRYLGTATLPGGAINDVNDLTKAAVDWKYPDSDDSYAGTILSLSSWYSTRPQGMKWFYAHLPQLKFVATANLLNSIDPNSHLTFTYNGQPGRELSLPSDKTIYQRICFTMNACESYRGLSDFALALNMLQDPDAKKYEQAASTIADGIRDMFDRDRLCFRVATNSQIGDQVKFYPDRFIQIAPQLYGVPLGPNTQFMYDAAWNYLNGSSDRWWLGEIADKTNGGQPMMMLGHVAAMRGENEKATKQLGYFQERLVSFPELGKIHELGHALKISEFLHRKSIARPLPIK